MILCRGGSDGFSSGPSRPGPVRLHLAWRMTDAGADSRSSSENEPSECRRDAKGIAAKITRPNIAPPLGFHSVRDAGPQSITARRETSGESICADCIWVAASLSRPPYSGLSTGRSSRRSLERRGDAALNDSSGASTIAAKLSRLRNAKTRFSTRRAQPNQAPGAARIGTDGAAVATRTAAFVLVSQMEAWPVVPGKRCRSSHRRLCRRFRSHASLARDWGQTGPPPLRCFHSFPRP